MICGSTVARTDMLGKVKAGLGDRLAAVFAEVKAHTPVEMVERGLAMFRDSGADLLVTVGGGSAIDAGKAISDPACDRRRSRTIRHPLCTGRRDGEAAVAQAHCTACRGADHRGLRLRRDADRGGARPALAGEALVLERRIPTPSATVLDPEMAVYTPAALTAATGMTAMARAVETLYSAYRHPISTGLALHAVRLQWEALPRSVAMPHDLDARGVSDGLYHVRNGRDQCDGVGRPRHRPYRRRPLRLAARHFAFDPAGARHAPLLPTIGGDRSLFYQPRNHLEIAARLLVIP